jgi:hypothetical protein
MVSRAPINSSRPRFIHHNSLVDIRPKGLPRSNFPPLVSTNSHMVRRRRNNNGRANHRNNILREAIHHRSSIRLRERILRINTLHRANILPMVSILRREVTRRKANPAIHPLRRLNQCPLRHP